MRRNDVALTSIRHHVPTRFLINQCQIITFLILKSYIIQNSRIELRGIVLPGLLNQIKVTFIIILPFRLVYLRFFLFHIEIEGKCGSIIRGGQRVCWPPAPPPPHPPQIIGAPTWPPLFLRLCKVIFVEFSAHLLCFSLCFQLIFICKCLSSSSSSSTVFAVECPAHLVYLQSLSMRFKLIFKCLPINISSFLFLNNAQLVHIQRWKSYCTRGVHLIVSLWFYRVRY